VTSWKIVREPAKLLEPPPVLSLSKDRQIPGFSAGHQYYSARLEILHLVLDAVALHPARSATAREPKIGDFAL
jgi:hypothetical protein